MATPTVNVTTNATPKPASTSTDPLAALRADLDRLPWSERLEVQDYFTRETRDLPPGHPAIALAADAARALARKRREQAQRGALSMTWRGPRRAVASRTADDATALPGAPTAAPTTTTTDTPPRTRRERKPEPSEREQGQQQERARATSIYTEARRYGPRTQQAADALVAAGTPLHRARTALLHAHAAEHDLPCKVRHRGVVARLPATWAFAWRDDERLRSTFNNDLRSFASYVQSVLDGKAPDIRQQRTTAADLLRSIGPDLAL